MITVSKADAKYCPDKQESCEVNFDIVDIIFSLSCWTSITQAQKMAKMKSNRPENGIFIFF